MAQNKVWKVESIDHKTGKPFSGAHGTYPRVYLTKSGMVSAVRVQESMGNKVTVFEATGWTEIPTP